MLRAELTTQLIRTRTLIALAFLAAVPALAAASFASSAGHRNGTQGGLFGASPYSALNHAMASLEFSRQADVQSVEFLGQDMTDQITLVTALHDHDEHAGLGIVQSGRQHFIPDPERGLTDDVGFHAFNIMGIIEHDDVGAKTGDR